MLMETLTKHANVRDTYGGEFASELGESETLANGTQTLKIMRGTDARFVDAREFQPTGPWTDLSAQFVEAGTVTVSGTQVGAWLKKRAAAGEQAPGDYVMIVEVVTSTGRRLVRNAILRVSDEGV